MDEPLVLLVTEPHTHLDGRLVLCDGDDQVAETVAELLRVAPLHGRRSFFVQRGIEMPEAFLDSVRSRVADAEALARSAAHVALMAHIAEVEKGSLLASLDGTAMDAHDLAAMTDEDLSRVVLRPAPGRELGRVLFLLRSAGLLVEEP